MTDIDMSIRYLIDHLVDHVPGVTGALVSSADGFVLAARLPGHLDAGDASVAAMSAASLALANRLVGLTGPQTIDVSIQRSADGQVFVFGVAHVAVLTVVTSATTDIEQICSVGREVGHGLQRLFRGIATV